MPPAPQSQHTAVTRAAILAGGLSSRMGREKALLPFQGVPLITRIASLLRPLFPDLTVVTANPEVARAAGCPSVADVYPGCGPLGGIHAALGEDTRPCLVVACDLPFLNAAFLRHLCGLWNGHDAVVPFSDGGPEPLQAVYGGACVTTFGRHLAAAATGTRVPSLRRIMTEVSVLEVPVEMARRFDPELALFENWNTPGDLRDTL